MFVPWVVVAVLWAVGCSLFAFDAIFSRQIATSVQEMSLPAVNALDQVQRERLRSLEVLNRPGTPTAELLGQQRATDGALQQLAEKAGPVLGSAPDHVVEPMYELNGHFERLPGMRHRIATGEVSVDELNAFYDAMFDTATRLFDIQSRITPDPEARQGALAAVALFRASDMLSRESSVVGTALAREELTPAEHRQLTGHIVGHRTTVATTATTLLPEVRQRYAAMTANPDWKQLALAEDQLIAHGPFGPGDRPQLRAEDWRRMTNDIGAEMSNLVRTQSELVAAGAVSRATGTLWTVLLGGLAALAISVVSFLFARRVYRVVVDDALLTRLQGLRTDSLAMAERLPDVVRRLREGEAVDVDAEVDGLKHYGSDEVGEVAHAIQLFQREAVQAAVGEARARQGARVVFVGMAHRIQRLLRSMHTTIDQLERDEGSSQQLATLFELDNSTTRARRTVENLLVLGDQQPGRRWTRPVALMDVLRSAISEIDQYSRVVIDRVPDVMLHGAAVGDTIHLLSELIDNATAFSPPSTQVHVGVDEVARGIAIDISDQGLGMDPETRRKANEMMHEPPEFDRLVLENNKAEQLGLFTAARLASRREISVEFGASAYGGARATVLLPHRILDTGPRRSDGDTAQVPVDAVQRRHDLAGNLEDWTSDEPQPINGARAGRTAVPQPREMSWDGRMTDQPATGADDTSADASTGSAAALDEPAQDQGPQREEQNRPALPKRVPQTHLADGLQDDPDAEEAVVASPSKLAGFRRAFRGGVDERDSSGS
ncbi:histidine kinase [Saccharopolyspora rhizosphaerae]|uniref:histidine kinase n=1 Tax=Saccharopolyspora rhizosphaerae TaxID=2492662 RepID=A0A426K3C7_9PSEU|nr:nitrate- and nitrite sensing domain-containing protein [Saccharopolyspora rhizosphaerae]RRO19962.1 histidine kinase [Saccharopolyspora rhizosphaerae]